MRIIFKLDFNIILRDCKMYNRNTIISNKSEMGSKYLGYRAPSIITSKNGIILCFVSAKPNTMTDHGENHIVIQKSYGIKHICKKSTVKII